MGLLTDILAKIESDPATEAKQDALTGLIGEVQASPTSNTVLDRLKALLTGIQLAAGTNLVGKVGIDQATANANEVVVKSITAMSYLGKDRTTTTGAAEELTIPASAKKAIISCALSSQAYIELNADATTTSPLYIEDPFGPLVLDLGLVTKLSAYVVAGNLGVVFFG